MQESRSLTDREFLRDLQEGSDPIGLEQNQQDSLSATLETVAQFAASMPLKRQEEQAKSLLKNKLSASLETIKEKVKLARKPQMRVVEYYLCDSCDIPIIDPSQGFIIQGNIYVANTSNRGGLIGNNFPQVKEGEEINLKDINEVVYCKHCFMKALNMENDIFCEKCVKSITVTTGAGDSGISYKAEPF